MGNITVDFQDYKTEWLTDVVDGEPTAVDLGNRFCQKLARQWLELNEYSD